MVKQSTPLVGKPTNATPKDLKANMAGMRERTEQAKQRRKFSMAEHQPEQADYPRRPFMDKEMLCMTQEPFVIENIIVTNGDYGESFLLFTHFLSPSVSFKTSEEFHTDEPLQDGIISLSSNKIRLKIFTAMSEVYGFSLTESGNGTTPETSDAFFLDRLGRAFVLVDCNDATDFPE